VNNCRQRTAIASGEGKISYRRNSFLTLTAVGMILFLLGVSTAVAQSAVPLLNAPLFPGVKLPGSAAFTLSVTGTGFVSGAVVYWNGTRLTTTFVNSGEVTASVSAADVATAQTARVTVANPGGVVSNVDTFEVVKGGYPVAYGKIDYATDIGPQAVVAGDFAGKGIQDLAVATGNNSVSVLMGSGTGTFPTHVEYPVPGNPTAIVTGDFNGDGKLDLATADPYRGEVTILLGNGDGTFQAHQEYPAGNEPIALVAADVNADGKLDLVVVDVGSNQVAVLLGNGNGTFQNPVQYATGLGPAGVVVGDFNGDGKLDLAVPNNTDNTVSILLGNGNGTYQTAVPYATAVSPSSIAVGDFSANGKLDLAIGTSNKAVSILMGNGNGTFQNHKEYTIGANSFALAVGDMNSDGKLDLISANYNDNTVSVLSGNGDGSFKNEVVFPVGAGPSALAVADFNNNGKLDIASAAVTPNTISILLDGEITFSPSVTAFGKETSGFTSAAKNITVKNNGTTAYTLGAISWIGTDPTDFATPSNSCPTSLPAGQTCTISVTFTPTASESANAQLLYTAANGSVVGAEFEGTGNIPIELTPRNLTFTYQLLGTTSKGQTTTFTNMSGVPITFTLIDLEGPNTNEFTLVPTSTCLTLTNFVLAAGASCTTTITYTPNVVQQASVTEVFYGNFTLAKQGSLIKGEATGVQVTPTTLNFGTQKSGTTSAPMKVSFYNANTTALPITSTVFSGSVNYWSLTTGTNQCTSSVPAQSTCYFYIVFTPEATGNFTGTFKIGDGDPTGPQAISLSGTGD
jgi:hypothetical protein